MFYDVIIVGSGAGGSAAAYQFAQSGAKTLLLERGPALPRDGSTLSIAKVVRDGLFKHSEYWLDNRGHKFQPSEYANLGGKTKWYGAALLRFAPHEFGSDEPHQCPAWPIGYDDLAPFYDEAETLLRVQRFATEPDLQQIVTRLEARDGKWRREPLPIGLDQAILSRPEEAHRFDGFASPSGLKSDAEVRLIEPARGRNNLTVLTGANVVDLVETSNPREVTGIRCHDSTIHYGARIVLAGGALHSPRLLAAYLARTGLTNRLPCAESVGRHYKCHLNTALLVFSTAALGDPLRKTTLLLHDAFPHSSVQNTGWIDGEILATQLPGIVPRWASDMIGRRVYGFWVTTEDGSHPDNRVVPGLNGGRHPRIDYERTRIAPAEAEHVALLRTLRRQLLSCGYISVGKRMGVDNTAHACGTLAAGQDPARSVVDRDGKVHGLSNVYVADGSVMTRSGRVNPALTIYAWGLRLASRIAASA